MDRVHLPGDGSPSRQKAGGMENDLATSQGLPNDASIENIPELLLHPGVAEDWVSPGRRQGQHTHACPGFNELRHQVRAEEACSARNANLLAGPEIG